MLFYEIVATRTSLGGSPVSDRTHSKVWDNAYNHVQHLRECYEREGSRLCHEPDETVSPYKMEFMNWKTGVSHTIEVYTCEFAD